MCVCVCVREREREREREIKLTYAYICTHDYIDKYRLRVRVKDKVDVYCTYAHLPYTSFLHVKCLTLYVSKLSKKE